MSQFVVHQHLLKNGKIFCTQQNLQDLLIYLIGLLFPFFYELHQRKIIHLSLRHLPLPNSYLLYLPSNQSRVFPKFLF